MGLHCQVGSNPGSRPAPRHQLGLVGSAWWVCTPAPVSAGIPPRGAPQHPGRQQGCWGQPGLRAWWCGVPASPYFLAKRKGAMCSDKWRVNGAPGQGEARQPDAARVTWGGGPPGPSRSRRGSCSLPAGASSPRLEGGHSPRPVLPASAWRPGAVGGGLRPHTPGCGSRPAGLRKPARRSRTRRLLKASRGRPSRSPAWAASSPQPPPTLRRAPRAPGSGIRAPLSARQSASWIRHTYLHF